LAGEVVASHLVLLRVAQLEEVLVVEEVVAVLGVQVQVQVRVAQVVESRFSLVEEGVLGVLDLWLIRLVLAPH
jgi:hypothetical protein